MKELLAAMLAVGLGVLLGFGIGVMTFGEDYQRGQTDALNGVWKYQKVTTNDGVVHYLPVTTQPAK